MNSKETLNKIYNYIMIDYDMGLMNNEETEALTEDYNIIKQDLERLETLEKENQELKEKCKILEENEESVLTTLEISVQRNVKLRKVIETLKKSLLLGVGELRGSYYLLAHDNNYSMTKEEYDLLKEVLEDDNS